MLTSAWHLRRTMHSAERAGLEARPIAADFRGGRYELDLLTPMPTARSFYRLHIALWEVVGASWSSK